MELVASARSKLADEMLRNRDGTIEVREDSGNGKLSYKRVVFAAEEPATLLLCPQDAGQAVAEELKEHFERFIGGADRHMESGVEFTIGRFLMNKGDSTKRLIVRLSEQDVALLVSNREKVGHVNKLRGKLANKTTATVALTQKGTVQGTPRLSFPRKSNLYAAVERPNCHFTAGIVGHEAFKSETASAEVLDALMKVYQRVMASPEDAGNHCGGVVVNSIAVDAETTYKVTDAVHLKVTAVSEFSFRTRKTEKEVRCSLVFVDEAAANIATLEALETALVEVFLALSKLSPPQKLKDILQKSPLATTSVDTLEALEDSIKNGKSVATALLPKGKKLKEFQGSFKVNLVRLATFRSSADEKVARLSTSVIDDIAKVAGFNAEASAVERTIIAHRTVGPKVLYERRYDTTVARPVAPITLIDTCLLPPDSGYGLMVKCDVFEKVSERCDADYDEACKILTTVQNELGEDAAADVELPTMPGGSDWTAVVQQRRTVKFNDVVVVVVKNQTLAHNSADGPGKSWAHIEVSTDGAPYRSAPALVEALGDADAKVLWDGALDLLQRMNTVHKDIMAERGERRAAIAKADEREAASLAAVVPPSRKTPAVEAVVEPRSQVTPDEIPLHLIIYEAASVLSLPLQDMVAKNMPSVVAKLNECGIFSSNDLTSSSLNILLETLPPAVVDRMVGDMDSIDPSTFLSYFERRICALEDFVTLDSGMAPVRGVSVRLPTPVATLAAHQNVLAFVMPKDPIENLPLTVFDEHSQLALSKLDGLRFASGAGKHNVSLPTVAIGTKLFASQQSPLFQRGKFIGFGAAGARPSINFLTVLTSGAFRPL